jgi:hypothetical protein
VIAAALGASVAGSVRAIAAPTPQTCPSLTSLAAALGNGATVIDCNHVADLTTANNIYTDHGPTTGMGFPPPGSGSLNSKSSNATAPAVPGLQIDGYFPDGCNAFQAEPAALTAAQTSGVPAPAPFLPGCTPPTVAGQTCVSACHQDGSFVLRIPDSWDGHLLSAGTPGIRDQFASDFVFSDFAVEKGWAYVSQDKGNMGANFYRDGCDETGSCGSTATSTWDTYPGACATAPAISVSGGSWCPGTAIAEWTFRMRQATRASRSLLGSGLINYGIAGVTYSYAAGISNGGYQARRAVETDTPTDHLYDGGVDWEGTLFIPTLPAGVTSSLPVDDVNLFGYLPTSLAHYPGDVGGTASDVAALGAVGFNPQSQPLWAYHWGIYWGLTQKVYRLEFDPEYTNYTCTGVELTSCVSPAAEAVSSTDPDATYNYHARLTALPAIATRIALSQNTGDIKHPLITLHGDQDSLLPIKTDSDLYSQMVGSSGHAGIYRYYVVQGGNHVDSQFDDHNNIDAYGNNVLRPILPCVRAMSFPDTSASSSNALDALAAWVEIAATPPPPSGVIPRPVTSDAATLANHCDLNSTLAANLPEGAPTILIATGTAVVVILGLARANARRRRSKAAS